MDIDLDVEPKSAPASGEPFTSPGQMTVHYAPRTPAIRVGSDDLARFPWPESAALLVFGAADPPEVPTGVVREVLRTPAEAARRLYALLHACDAAGLALIVVVPPPDRPEWAAVRDRIARATRPGSTWESWNGIKAPSRLPDR